MLAEKMFAEDAAREVKGYLSPEYGDVECEAVEMKKNNGVLLAGVKFCKPGSMVEPIVYVGAYYDAIQQGVPKGEIMAAFVRDAERAMEVKETPEIGDYEKVRGHLRMRLVNTEANQSELADMPHREMEDLSLLFSTGVSLSGVDTGTSSKVTYALADLWGVSEETLYEQARENMEQEAVLKSMSDVMKELCSEGWPSKNLLSGPVPEQGGLREVPMPMYVLTNHERRYGAAVMGCPGVMEKVSRMFPEGFYILPSSIHELIIVPKTIDHTPEELGKMVRSVNRSTDISREEILSDHIYEYDKERGKVCQVQEAPEQDKQSVLLSGCTNHFPVHDSQCFLFQTICFITLFICLQRKAVYLLLNIVVP